MNQAADTTRTSHPKAVAGGLRRMLLWAGGATAGAVCIVILLLWGIHGPTYLLDLIAAYCF